MSFTSDKIKPLKRRAGQGSSFDYDDKAASESRMRSAPLGACASLRSLGLFMLIFIALICLSGCSGRKRAEQLRSSAIESYDAGNYEEAEVLFNRALDADRGSVSKLQIDILKYRAECELRQGKYEAALDTYTVLLNVDDDKEALSVYEEMIGGLSGLDVLEEMLSEMEAGNYEEAYELADSYASLDGDDIGRFSWFNKAVCAEYLGNYEEAYELFDSYLRAFPDDEEAEKEARFLRTR